MYFTGDLSARLVLIHLNPKQDDNSSGEYERPFEYHDVDDYIERHRRFGYYHWQLDRTYRSAFDHKQVRFLRPFGIIDFLPGRTPSEKRANCERAIDQKLQLELIPYGSRQFLSHKLSPSVLAPHYERLMGAVAAYPRDYTIFCGAVFDKLFETHVITRDDQRFRLPTSAGESKTEYRFSNLVLDYAGHATPVGLAQSFATQGIPMEAYGAACHARYQALTPIR